MTENVLPQPSPTAIAEDAPIKEIPPGTTHFVLQKGAEGPNCVWPDEQGVEIKYIPIADFSKAKILERWGYHREYSVRFMVREDRAMKSKSPHAKLFGLPAPTPTTQTIPVGESKVNGAAPSRMSIAGDMGTMLALNESLTALQEAKSERQFTLEQERNRSYQESQREAHNAAMQMQREGMMGMMQMQNSMMQQMQAMQAQTMTTVITALTGGFRNQEVEALRQEIQSLREGDEEEETDDEVIGEAFSRMATGDVIGGLKEIALKRGGKKVAQAWPMIEQKAGEFIQKIRDKPADALRNGRPQIVEQPNPPVVGVK